MIPKKIHYCWFGNQEKDKLIRTCLDTWKEKLPGYEIIEWNEKNYPIENSSLYVQNMYKKKRWAFVSDYARLDILYTHGGIYLDTDMYVLQSLDVFLKNTCFLGKESAEYINAAIMGSVPYDPFIKKCKEIYDNTVDIFKPIPTIITDLYNKKDNTFDTVTLYETSFFYPFSAKNISRFDPTHPPKDAYTVHMWNYSWGNHYNRFLIRIGLHDRIITILNFLGIKNVMKKLFNIAH
jgi:hypothetical protein